MHGMTALARDYIPASFQIGPAWFVVFGNWAKMRWIVDVDFGGCFRLQRDIMALGFETFAPAERRYVSWRKRKRESITPAFGSYVFVRFDRELDSWGQIFDVNGVHDIIRTGNIPIRVPDFEMNTLLAAERGGLFDYVASPFSEGQTVEITEGPWMGLVGHVRSASPRKRVKILLNALGMMEIEPHFLRKV